MFRYFCTTFYLLAIALGGCKRVEPDVNSAAGATVRKDTLYSIYVNGRSRSPFLSTLGLVVDKADNLYFTDIYGNRIGEIFSTGTVRAFAGTGIIGDQDGLAAKATLFSPTDLKFSPDGKLTIATNYAIRQLQPDGTVNTLLGNGASGDHSLLAGLFYIAFDQQGNLYITAWGNNMTTDWRERGAKILKVTPDKKVTTLVRQYKDETLQNQWYDQPRNLVVDSKGNLFIEAGYYGILKVNQQGELSTFVGTDHHPKSASDVENQFSIVSGMVIDKDDNILFGGDSYLCKATPSGEVSILAGKVNGVSSGWGNEVSFGGMRGMALDSKGNLYITHLNCNTIYKVSFSN